MERCNYCPLRSHLMNKNKRIVFGIVGGSLYMLGFIVDDTDILVQLITTVLMLCGLIMIILSFLLLANDLEAKETIKNIQSRLLMNTANLITVYLTIDKAVGMRV